MVSPGCATFSGLTRVSSELTDSSPADGIILYSWIIKRYCYTGLHSTWDYILHGITFYTGLHSTWDYILHWITFYMELHVTCDYMLHRIKCYMLHIMTCYMWKLVIGDDMLHVYFVWDYMQIHIKRCYCYKNSGVWHEM